MSRIIEQTLHKLIVRAIKFAIPLQARSGEFLVPPAINAYKIFYDQQINTAIAYCLSRKFVGNPFTGDAKVMAAMERSLRYMLDVGGLANPAEDGSVEHRNLRSTIVAVQIAGNIMSPRIRSSLAAAHRACLDKLKKKMRRFKNVRVFDARTLKTGTNHFWGYLATTALLARHLGDEATVDELLPFAERFALAQDRTGHWTENAGPTSCYTRVSNHFMGLATDIWPTPTMLTAAHRAAEFQIRFAYADGTPIECFDERVQAGEPFYDLAMPLTGATLLDRHPEGPAWFLSQIKKMKIAANKRPTFSSLEFTFHAVDALLRIDRLNASSPWTASDLMARGDGFGTMRRGAWQVGWQAMPTRDWHGNPFFLDRQNLFSLAHVDIGRLVNGSNSKCQNEVGSFAASGSESFFADRKSSLPMSGEWKAKGGLGVLHVQYPEFTAELAFIPHGPDSIKLRVDTRPIRRRQLRRLRFNVILPYYPGATLRLSDQSSCVLGSETPIALARPIHGWIDNGRIRFSASRAFTATWPFIPFSSYRSPFHQRDFKDSWFVISVALDAKSADQIELHWRLKK